MNRRQLLAGIAATALAPQALGMPLGPPHPIAAFFSDGLMTFRFASGASYRMTVDAAIKRINSVPDRWTQNTSSLRHAE